MLKVNVGVAEWWLCPFCFGVSLLKPSTRRKGARDTTELLGDLINLVAEQVAFNLFGVL